MKRFGICVLVCLSLIIVHYFNYTSLSKPVEADPFLCWQAIETGTVYRDPIDLKTLYPLTEPIYSFLNGRVYQLNASYHDGRSMVCLEFDRK